MPIKVECVCGKKLSVKDELGGRRVKCPACRETLNVPKFPTDKDSVDDEWDLEDSAEQQSMNSKKSRGRKEPSTSTSGSGKRKTKGSSSQNLGLLIGLSAAGGVVALALLVWVFWPAKPGNNVADTPVGNSAVNSGTTVTETTSGSNPTSTGRVSPPSVGSAPASNTTTAVNTTVLDGDLKQLQGTWHIIDIAIGGEEPPPAELAAAKLMTWTFAEDLMTMSRPDGNPVSVSTVKLDPTQSPKTADLNRLDVSGTNKMGLAIYSLDGDSLKWCMTKMGVVRPKEIKPDKTLDQIVATLKKGTAKPGDNPNGVATRPQFDLKVWRQASEKLKDAKVFTLLASRQDIGESGFPDGLSHCAIIDPPETADGTISPELWEIVSSVSHIMLRTKFVTDATLKQVSLHPGLIGFNVSGRLSVTAVGIAELKKCPYLRSLFFDGVSVSMDMVSEIAQLSELRYLGINETPVTGEMVEVITRLPKLESLGLNSSGITDDDAVQIAKMTTLNTLLVDRTKITDKGLAILKGLSGLTIFSIRGLAVTPQAVAELEAALPKCKVLK